MSRLFAGLDRWFWLRMAVIVAWQLASSAVLWPALPLSVRIGVGVLELLVLTPLLVAPLIRYAALNVARSEQPIATVLYVVLSALAFGYSGCCLLILASDLNGRNL
jgi:hypothetical protein